VQIVDKCKKKHPGVLCSCGTKESSLEVSATVLTFDKKSRKGSITVSNPGNVPLAITLTESGDTDAFALRATRRCRKKPAAPAERQELRALSTPSSATVSPQGCATLRVRFGAKKQGVYTEQLGIQSDATTPPMSATVALSGSLGTTGTQPSTTTTTTLSTCSPTGGTCAVGVPCCNTEEECVSGICCLGVGASCTASSKCCAGLPCTNGICQSGGCGGNHASCTTGLDCCPGLICFTDSTGTAHRCCSNTACSVDGDCCYQSPCTSGLCQ
jgi:hypothetical protein